MKNKSKKIWLQICNSFNIIFIFHATNLDFHDSKVLINSKACKKVLLLTGDTTSKVINNKDRSLKMVFGDGGSATLIEVGTDVLSFIIYSDGSQYNDLIILDLAENISLFGVFDGHGGQEVSKFV